MLPWRQVGPQREPVPMLHNAVIRIGNDRGSTDNDNGPIQQDAAMMPLRNGVPHGDRRYDFWMQRLLRSRRSGLASSQAADVQKSRFVRNLIATCRFELLTSSIQVACSPARGALPRGSVVH